MASTFLIIVVFVLDLIAFGLGIGAEQRRATGEYVKDSTTDYQYCRYTSDIATGLAVGALLFLLTSQVLILASTRCLCCGNSLKPGAARAFAVIFFILTWASFLIAAICYLAGAVQNAKHIRYLSYFPVTDKPTCSAIRKDTFAAGVAFTFFTFILSISYYLCCSKAQSGSWKNQFNNRGEGVNMASYS
ncbi:hypothetical protein KP509_36G004300 [Ceratopteris richardii]|uniref:Fiber protein Fb34 n=1 Tax=Ceratopteris richardii TaxID=49495 RepID=A0A8T2QAF4_CERRI|nr:hypothetical protein KP509_36G004300 [Ceratopteris richardii]KAH7280588.1 hypothetical protein KP509_36G004300 [Ceratopteris richardii]